MLGGPPPRLRTRAGGVAAAYQAAVGHCALNRQARGHWVRRRADGSLTYMSLDRGALEGDAAADAAAAERAFITSPAAFSLPWPAGEAAGAGASGDAAAPPPLFPPAAVKLESWGVPPVVAAAYESLARIRGLHAWQVDALRHSDFGVLRGRNMVFCAPTSGGKTLVAEVAMLHTLLARGRKVLYVVPFVSLCREKLQHLSSVWAPLQIKVTGLYSSRGASTFYKTDVAVCTLERANGLLNRLVVEDRLSDVGLIVVDEVHLLGDASRGFLLEMMLMKALLLPHARTDALQAEPGERPAARHPNDRLQIIAMSATLPNIGDLATWLSATLFTATSRPVPLDTLVECSGVVYDGQLRPLRLLMKAHSEGSAAAAPGAVYTQHHVVAAHRWLYGLTDEAPATVDVRGDGSASLLLHSDGSRVRWAVERPRGSDGAAVVPTGAGFTTARTTLHGGHGAAAVPPCDTPASRMRALLGTAVAPLWLGKLAASHPRTCALAHLLLGGGGGGGAAAGDGGGAAPWNGAADLQALPCKVEAIDRIAMLAAETVVSGGCVIVFVPTPRAAREYALQMADRLQGARYAVPALRDAVARLQSGDLPAARAALVEQLAWTPCGCDEGLERCLRVGCGFHHGGLLDEERAIVEAAFRGGCAPILFATSTLAAGVNLPATRVIVCSLTDYGGTPKTNLLTAARFRQMAGRAGRTGFAERGEVVLMVTDFRGGPHWDTSHGFEAPPFGASLPPALPLTSSASTAIVLQLQDGRLGGEPAAARSGMHCARTWLAARQMAGARDAIVSDDDPVSTCPNALTYAMTLLWGDQQPVRSALTELTRAASPAADGAAGTVPLRRALMELVGTGFLWRLDRGQLVRILSHSFAAAQAGRAAVAGWCTPAVAALVYLLRNGFVVVRDGATYAPLDAPAAEVALAALSVAPPPAPPEDAGGDDPMAGGGHATAVAEADRGYYVAATALGMGCFLSSMSPEVALGVAGELHRAAMCLRNECGDLHAVFLLTPVEGLDVQPAVATQALSSPGSVLFVPLELREYLLGAGAGPERDGRLKRLAAARALSVLMQESADAPMAAVADCLGQSNARGKLQTLQTAAGMHAAMVCTLAREMRSPLAGVLRALAPRLEFGVKPELLPLLQLPGLSPSMARSLYACGIVDAATLAAADEETVIRAVTARISQPSKPFAASASRGAASAAGAATPVGPGASSVATPGGGSASAASASASRTPASRVAPGGPGSGSGVGRGAATEYRRAVAAGMRARAAAIATLAAEFASLTARPDDARGGGGGAGGEDREGSEDGDSEGGSVAGPPVDSVGLQAGGGGAGAGAGAPPLAGDGGDVDWADVDWGALDVVDDGGADGGGGGGIEEDEAALAAMEDEDIAASGGAAVAAAR